MLEVKLTTAQCAYTIGLHFLFPWEISYAIIASMK